MVSDIFGIFEIIFLKCVEWSTSLFERTGAAPFYVAAVIIVFVVSFLVLPLRGGSIGGMADGFQNDYSKVRISKKEIDYIKAHPKRNPVNKKR